MGRRGLGSHSHGTSAVGAVRGATTRVMPQPLAAQLVQGARPSISAAALRGHASPRHGRVRRCRRPGAGHGLLRGARVGLALPGRFVFVFCFCVLSHCFPFAFHPFCRAMFLRVHVVINLFPFSSLCSAARRWTAAVRMLLHALTDSAPPTASGPESGPQQQALLPTGNERGVTFGLKKGHATGATRPPPPWPKRTSWHALRSSSLKQCGRRASGTRSTTGRVRRFGAEAAGDNNQQRADARQSAIRGPHQALRRHVSPPMPSVGGHFKPYAVT